MTDLPDDVPTTSDWSAYKEKLIAALRVIESAHAECPTGENTEMLAIEESLSIEITRCCAVIDYLNGANDE